MLKIEGLQAVCIATVTTVHAEETIKAIEKDLHVLCEKPLSTSVEIVSFPLPDLYMHIVYYTDVCGRSHAKLQRLHARGHISR